MRSPYKIEGPALISFSGGRTSGFMLKKIIDAHGGTLPEDVIVTFANTAKEREETLQFVHDCETHWGIRIHWLERTGKKTFNVVDFATASRNGEPFKQLIAEKKYLPNAVTRFCTIELKIRVMKEFALSLGWKHWKNVVGLRADEPHRVARGIANNAKGKERWKTVMPMAEDGTTNRIVRAWWSDQPFDLQLLPFEGNCDACFLKARPKLFEIERERPGTLDWWIEAEAEATIITGKKSGARFVTEWTYAELQQAVQRQPDLFAGAFDDDEIEMDAECGTMCGAL